MTDLVEFLRARLDEDKQAARATTGPWKYHHETGGVVLPTALHVPELSEIVSTPREPSDARHMVRWDSARVLREVEAKRQTIDRLVAAMEEDYAPWNEDILIVMASVYADHPDYRREWVV